MQRVGARQGQVDEIDLRLYYELHRQRFASPERRTARHILITLNDRFEGNRRDRVLARMEGLRERLGVRSSVVARHFPDLARRHSECPTALEGGRLGQVRRGQLYPELDGLLFRLGEGQVGGPVESELGFHFLWCERIHPGKALPFAKVRDSIHEALVERRRRDGQKAWLAELRQTASRNPATHP
jgi:peptidyl-prolyl cis-trans isomerase C